MIINYNSMANNNISMLMCMITKLLQLISHDQLGDFIMIVMMMISYCHSISYTCSRGASWPGWNIIDFFSTGNLCMCMHMYTNPIGYP